MSPGSVDQSRTFRMVEGSPTILHAGKIDRSLIKDNDFIIVDVSAKKNERVFVRTFNSCNSWMNNKYDENQYGTNYQTEYLPASLHFRSSSSFALQQQSQFVQNQSFLHKQFEENRKRPYHDTNGFQTVPPVFSGYSYNQSNRLEPNAAYYAAPQQYPSNSFNDKGIGYASTAETYQNYLQDTTYMKELRETYERLTQMAEQCDMSDKYARYAGEHNNSSIPKNYDREKILQKLRSACIYRQSKYELYNGVADRPSNETGCNFVNSIPTSQTVESPENKFANHSYPLAPPLRRVRNVSDVGQSLNETIVPHVPCSCETMKCTTNLSANIRPNTEMYEMSATPHTDMYEMNKRLKMSPTDSGIDCTETPEDDLNIESFNDTIPTHQFSASVKENDNPKKGKGARLKITRKEVDKVDSKPKWMTSKMSSWKKREAEFKDRVESETKPQNSEHISHGEKNKLCKKSNLKTVIDKESCGETNNVEQNLCDKEKHENAQFTEDSISSPMNLVIDIGDENETDETYANDRPKKLIKQFF